MMRLVMLAAIALGTGAEADTVRVRTGDHDGFTRIVIDISPVPDWSAGRTESGYAVAVSGVQTFDLSNVFRIIGRNRVANFRSDGQILNIDVACACHARIFEIDNRRLVIDVRDGPPPVSAKFETAFVSPAMPAAPAPTAQIDVSVVSGATYVSGDAPAIPSPEGPAPASNAPAAMDTANLSLSTALPTDVSSANESLNGLDLHLDTASQQGRAVQLLSNELARAVSQGLVDVDKTPTEGTESGVETTTSPANVNISTSIDRAFQSRTDRQEASAAGGICIADDDLDMSDWSEGKLLSELGKMRQAAYGEDGRITEKGALKLAKFYIASGFGAEASAVLRSIEPAGNHDLLLGMADIIDHGQSDDPMFVGQSSCKGRIALWSILARGLPIGERPTDRSHILRAFSELAPHLRSLLGPKLADHLKKAKLEEDALIVLNAARRAGNSSDRHALTAARLDLGGTAADTARDELVKLATGSGTIAAAALLELLEDAENRDVPPETAWVEDAADLARATLGTPVSKELSLAGLRARLVIGQFEEFRDLVARGQPGLGAEEVGPLSVAAIATAARTADDTSFIKTETAFSKVVRPDEMDEDDRFVVADRLLSLGLLNKATTYLPDTPETAEERRIYASILTAAGIDRPAVGLLAFRGEAELQQLLASAHLADQNIDGALAAFRRADKTDRAVELALGAGRFDWVVENGDTPVSDPTRALLSDRELIGIEPPFNGPLLAQSVQFRSSISDLLEAVPLPQ